MAESLTTKERNSLIETLLEAHKKSYRHPLDADAYEAFQVAYIAVLDAMRPAVETKARRYMVTGRFIRLSENGVIQIGLEPVPESTHEVVIVDSPENQTQPKRPVSPSACAPPSGADRAEKVGQQVPNSSEKAEAPRETQALHNIVFNAFKAGVESHETNSRLFWHPDCASCQAGHEPCEHGYHASCPHGCNAEKATAEPEWQWTRDDATTRDCLSLVSLDIPLSEIATWTDEQVQHAEQWSGACHAAASDNDEVEIPPEPTCISEWRARSALKTSGEPT